jgi:hypothetical protein
MKVSLRIARACLCVAVAASWTTLAAAQGAALGNVQVKGINVIEVDTSHVKIGVDLALTPSQSATLASLRLCALRLNGLPVFAAPLDQEIVLRKGEPVALPPLYVTVLFRDLYTVEPLRLMIEDRKVHVQGEMEAAVRLGFMGKLALHTQQPTVEVSLVQDVPVEVGGTPLERSIELGMLSVIESGLSAKATAEKVVPGARPAWIQDLDAQAKANVFEVESSYSLEKEDATYPVRFTQLGFRVGTFGVVTTAEAREPWKYDAEFLAAVKSGNAKLVKKSEEIQLWPMASGVGSLKLGAQDFTIDVRGNPAGDAATEVSMEHNKIQVLKRVSPTSLAVISLREPPAASGLRAASAEVAAKDAWEQAAVFRLRQNAATKERFVDVLQLSASRDGQSIHLSEPVDSAVFGSPIATPDGVIGLVQDEQTGAFLPAEAFSAAATPAPEAGH